MPKKAKNKVSNNTNQDVKVIILDDRDIDKEKYEDIIRKARYLARVSFPYYTSSLMAITFKFTYSAVDHAGNPTFLIDKHLRCYINPLIIDYWMKEAEEITVSNTCPTCSKSQHNKYAYLAGVILHEMCHPMQKHFLRAEPYHGASFNPAICNVAMDCELNDSLLESIKFCNTENICLPKGVCLPSLFEMPDNLYWEEYYELLLKKYPPDKDGNPKKGKGKKGKGESSDGPDELPSGGRCGSGADGIKAPFEEPGEGECDNFDGVSQAELDTINRKVAQEMKEHAAKHPGSIPGSMLRWADEMIGAPKYDWRSELSKMIRYCTSRYTTGHKITTFAKRSIVSTVLNDKVILPTYKKPLPHVAEIFDTSGSMSNEMIKTAVTEGEAVCRLLKAKVTIIDVDTEARVTKAKSLRSAKLSGGGGTDMRIGIKAALENRDKPNLIVIYSDGFSPWPDIQPKGVQVILCLCGAKNQVTDQNVPSWMKVIRVEPD